LGGLPATVGAAYRLIDNDGSDAVVGQFAGYAEGHEFLISDRLFKLSYHGGDGNDVEVTEQNRAPINTLPGELSVLRATALALTGANALSVADLGAGAGSITVHLHVAHGVLGMTAATGVTLAGNASGSASVFGTLAAVNETLATLQYTGNDTFVGTDILQMVSLDGSPGLDGVDIDSVAITVAALPGVTLTGNNQANVLTGTTGDDTLKGLGGSDTLVGLEGNDTLDGGSGNNTLIGGEGNDTYIVSSATDIIVEFAGEGVDEVQTGLASFSLAGSGKVENLTATTSIAHTFTGNGSANVITGHSGNDTLYGGNGCDTLIGGGGDDRLNGGGNIDTMSGGTGDDTYMVDNTGDVVNELDGEGTDTVITKVDYTLAAGSEIEHLKAAAGSGGLALTGNEFANRLTGGGGNDTLHGGAGRDILVGGAGNDIFAFADVADTPAGIDRDQIKDFASGDLIDLRGMEAATGVDFSFATGGFSHHAGDLRAYAAGSNTLVAGDINGDGRADFQILVAGAHTLDRADFLL
jgi:Ca2+-binding RTX toxin-like protein